MKLFLILFPSIFFSSSIARISLFNEAKTPVLIADLDEASTNIPFQRFWTFLKRTKRSSVRASSKPPIYADANKLGVGALHNQALIHWSGNYSNVIFILTRRKDSGGSDVSHSALWRSTDYGQKYFNETKKFDEKTLLKSYYTCPTNKTKVIFIDSYLNITTNHSRVWVSVNEGDSYEGYDVPFVVDKILFHPHEQDWLLGYDNKDRALYSSMNLGRNWTKLHDDVTQDRYFWYKKDVDKTKDADKIVYIEYKDYTAFDRPFYYVKSCHIPNCTNSFFQPKCDQLGPIEGHSLLVQDNYIFVQKPGALEKLFVSYNREEFVKARFHRSGEQTDIHVISSHSNTVVVGVNHNHGYTHLYFSDEKGQEFSLSLDNVLYFDKKVGNMGVFTVDIHEVKAVKGVYIANKNDLLLRNRTKITWDNGRTWSSLKPPPGSKTCYGCSLNLHCAMSSTKSGYYMPGMLSKESAPGLIMAHGSVGTTLVDAPPLVKLYVSNDTGLTWRDTLQARNLFVMGDQGSILVAVTMYFVRAVNTFSVSNDYGATWREFTFSRNMVNVDGVLTEPGEENHIFTIFGHESHQGPWKIFTIDMSRIIARNCSYPDDFGNVTIPFHRSSSCHLGMQRTIEILRNTSCLIGRDYKRKTSERRCNCTRNDYECDFDYVPYANRTHTICRKRAPSIDWIEDIVDYDDIFGSTPVQPCINNVRYQSRGYRKIPGDVCVNPIQEFLPLEIPCNATATTTTTMIFTTTSSSTISPTEFYLRLMNHSNVATMKSLLVVTAMHCDQYIDNNNWKVIFLNNTKLPVLYHTNNNSLSIYGHTAGLYEISATCRKKPAKIVVGFYHPIDKLVIMHPPVVKIGDMLTARAFLSAPRGLPGIPELLGPVKYTWYYHSQVFHGDTLTIDTGDIVVPETYGRPVPTIRLSVTVSNAVSIRSQTSSVHLKSRVVYLNVPLYPVVTDYNITHSSTWFYDLRVILTMDLFRVKAIMNLLLSKKLLHRGFHVYIEPDSQLTAKLYLSSWLAYEYDLSLEELKQVKTELHDIIMREDIVLHLSHGEKIYVGHLPSRGLSGAVIAVIVIVSILFVAALVYLARRYGRVRRWKSYFTMRSAPTLRLSHIVRPRDHDLAPIVNDDDDADEFFDDVMEPAQELDSPQDGTLQFKSEDGE